MSESSNFHVRGKMTYHYGFLPLVPKKLIKSPGSPRLHDNNPVSGSDGCVLLNLFWISLKAS